MMIKNFSKECKDVSKCTMVACFEEIVEDGDAIALGESTEHALMNSGPQEPFDVHQILPKY